MATLVAACRHGCCITAVKTEINQLYVRFDKC